jgi:hypothetical protein
MMENTKISILIGNSSLPAYVSQLHDEYYLKINEVSSVCSCLTFSHG